MTDVVSETGETGVAGVESGVAAALLEVIVAIVVGELDGPTLDAAADEAGADEAAAEGTITWTGAPPEPEMALVQVLPEHF